MAYSRLAAKDTFPSRSRPQRNSNCHLPAPAAHRAPTAQPSSPNASPSRIVVPVLFYRSTGATTSPLRSCCPGDMVGAALLFHRGVTQQQSANDAAGPARTASRTAKTVRAPPEQSAHRRNSPRTAQNSPPPGQNSLPPRRNSPRPAGTARAPPEQPAPRRNSPRPAGTASRPAGTVRAPPDSGTVRVPPDSGTVRAPPEQPPAPPEQPAPRRNSPRPAGTARAPPEQPAHRQNSLPHRQKSLDCAVGRAAQGRNVSPAAQRLGSSRVGRSPSRTGRPRQRLGRR